MKWFKIKDFASPDAEGSGEEMSLTLLNMLDYARDRAGIPFAINSGYRTEAHNKKVGGSETSSHLMGFAVDIHCNNSTDRMKMIDSLVQTGFKRIGIGNTFIHVDIDTRKPDAMWLY